MTARRQRRSALLAAAIIVAALSALLGAAAQAHFLLNAHNRVFVITPAADGVHVYLRIPTTLVFAEYLAARRLPADRVDAPFVVAEQTAQGFVHRLDAAAIEREWRDFGELAAQGYRFAVAGQAVAPRVLALKVQPAVAPPPFGTPEEARAALQGPVAAGAKGLFVGETVVDLALLLPDVMPEAPLSVVSTLPELALPEGVTVDNHFVDFRHGGRTTSIAGQLIEPAAIDRTAWQAAMTFVVSGVHHILIGPDHVLFVLCLALAATRLATLIWQVTGFTIGHSVTLAAGVLGLVPAAAWFIPAIETAIALSIVYVGVAAIRRRAAPSAVAVTAGLGLLHGFGFAFVLQDILGPFAPHLAVSLLSFNLGVEIGQVAIVVAAAAGLRLLSKAHQGVGRYGRIAVAGGAIAVAALWTVERLQLVAEAVAAA